MTMQDIWSDIGDVKPIRPVDIKFMSTGVYECEILACRTGVVKGGNNKGVQYVGTTVKILTAKDLPGEKNDALLEPGLEVGWGTLLRGDYAMKDAKAFITAAVGCSFEDVDAEIARMVWVDDGAAVQGNVIQVTVVATHKTNKETGEPVTYYNQRFEHVRLGE